MNKKKCYYLIGVVVLCFGLAACQTGKRKIESVTKLPSILAPEHEDEEGYSPAKASKPEAPAEDIQPVESIPQDEGDIFTAPSSALADAELESQEEEGGTGQETAEKPNISLPSNDKMDNLWDDDALRSALAEELSTCTGNWSLYWKCVETGETVSIGTEKMVAASLIKLFVAGAYYKAVEDGRLVEAPELAGPMIYESSNDACNRLIDLLGGGDAEKGMAYVNKFAASHGFSCTELNRKMLEQSEEENYTSAADCGNVLEMILNGTYVNKEASAQLLDYLKRQERTWKIPAGLPDGIETANKTGELADVENDAAIVWLPECTYILCIMSDDILSPSAGQYNITNLSRMVYDAWKPVSQDGEKMPASDGED